jgi:O-acetyl-ADP-ribose deacetylase (regulator of RNase III)
MKVDAIVNAANTALQMGGGVCGAIFRAAGAAELQAACDKLAPIETGEAVITPGFRLPAKYIIHTAGPVYRSGHSGEAAQLRSCYLKSLELASAHRCESIAFPLISSGIYGYPKDEARLVASNAIRDFLETHEMDVFLALLDRSSTIVMTSTLTDVATYIVDHQVDAKRQRPPFVREFSLSEPPIMPPPGAPANAPLASQLQDLIGSLDESFRATLRRLIDAKGKTNVEVYKRANIDRKLFSKINSTDGYTPSKRTVLALAVALELSLEETDDLLERAGYALSPAQTFDVIVEYFIVNGKYDIFEINDVLFEYEQPLLGI